MLKAVIDYECCAAYACDKCRARQICEPRAIIKIDSDEPAAVELSHCTGCGDCVTACPARAITIAEF